MRKKNSTFRDIIGERKISIIKKTVFIFSQLITFRRSKKKEEEDEKIQSDAVMRLWVSNKFSFISNEVFIIGVLTVFPEFLLLNG